MAYLQVEDARKGLEAEMDLFSSSEKGVLLWSARIRTLVCPQVIAQSKGFENLARNSEVRGWPIVLRQTGGGTVPQGPGILNLAMIKTVDKSFTIEEGYRNITQVFQSCFSRMGIHSAIGATHGSFCDGNWNLSIGGRKLVGTAQRWRSIGKHQTRILVHALLLVNGGIKPGVEAVDILHQELGLARVLDAAHTTLENELGPSTPDMKILASALKAAAIDELNKFDLQTG